MRFFVDLDGFKKINDDLGHDAGDAVLRIVSERFGQALRSADLLVRHGGDEFAVVVSEDVSRNHLGMITTNQMGWKADYIANLNASGDQMQSMAGSLSPIKAALHLKTPGCNWLPAR